MTSLKRTERSRALILDAAEIAFRELGFEGATVHLIAERAGLTRKTVYNLFGSKEDIALSLIARVEARDTDYRDRMAEGQHAVTLLEAVLIDSAHWCMANPAVARLALVPVQRPSLEPPSDRPSFQGLVRDILALGQAQGLIRKDEGPEFMALIVLGVYGQAMLNGLQAGVVPEADIRKIVRLVVEGIGGVTA
ncbi:TetR/AcrR family transcriptional regulator [Roseibium algicola]|uniref:TetR/AcrR family transcriptional regulator n=1 Tax=Roseibium algicola TaxID=2857014 RepID=UPI003458975E